MGEEKEVKQDSAEGVKEEEVDFSDIFVTEKDLFETKVKYYKKDNDIFVKGIDDDFDEAKECKKFTASFKYPSQGDSAIIEGAISGINMENFDMEKLNVKDFMKIEFARLLCLIRKWSLKKEVSNVNILQLNPKIVKSLTSQIRDKIGMEGII